jgi:hypothetical protein
MSIDPSVLNPHSYVFHPEYYDTFLRENLLLPTKSYPASNGKRIAKQFDILLGFQINSSTTPITKIEMILEHDVPLEEVKFSCVKPSIVLWSKTFDNVFDVPFKTSMDGLAFPFTSLAYGPGFIGHIRICVYTDTELAKDVKIELHGSFAKPQDRRDLAHFPDQKHSNYGTFIKALFRVFRERQLEMEKR